MLYSVIYKSKANAALSYEAVRRMLLKAKHFNKVHHITGCILYYKFQFIQLIEGDKKNIESLYSKIKADKRHHDVETLLSKPSKDSLWSEWSMAFYDFSDLNEQNKYLRLLLESNFEKAHKNQKNSEVLICLREQCSQLLDS